MPFIQWVKVTRNIRQDICNTLLKVNLKFSVVYMEKIAPYKHIADLELSMGALRKAGLK